MLHRISSLSRCSSAWSAKDCNAKLRYKKIRRLKGAMSHAGVVTAGSVDKEVKLEDFELERASQRRNEPATETCNDDKNNGHLVVLVNGLWGQAKHWDTMKNALYSSLGSEKYSIHASRANQLFATYDGIDACGRRLADEIQELAAGSSRNLKKISIIGHSMGGLISRNAIAKLFDRGSGTVCGLEPQHFITLATPHVGFDHKHESAGLPLTSWVSRYVPLGGETIGGFLDSVAPSIASTFLGKAGAEFFHRDDTDDFSIVYKMSFDHEDEQELYVTSLKSFKTRTVYANMSGDHLVGWENSSLRTKEEQRNLKIVYNEAMPVGVVREDPLECAWSNSEALVSSSKQIRHPEAVHERIEVALDNLRRIGWRRIDVCYHGSFVPFLSHQHIMVQRPFINSVGYSTVQHLSAQFARMEKVLE